MIGALLGTHAVYVQTDGALLERLSELANPEPFVVSPPYLHFPLTDLDDLAQHVVEGRCRHVPRRVFEPNSFAMKKGRK